MHSRFTAALAAAAVGLTAIGSALANHESSYSMPTDQNSYQQYQQYQQGQWENNQNWYNPDDDNDYNSETYGNYRGDWWDNSRGLEARVRALEDRVRMLEERLRRLETICGWKGCPGGGYSSYSSYPPYSSSYSYSSRPYETQFRANLTGNQEVPPLQTPMSGRGRFTLSGDDLWYEIEVENVVSPITAAHFHIGAAGQEGGILASIGIINNRAMGTWQNLTPQQIQDLQQGRIYVNVHTQRYPDGEIRGQVLMY